MSLGKYAANTSVPVERSRAEVERILTKYGATKFGTMSEQTHVTVYFEVKGRQVQWTLPLPARARYRAETDYDREVRRRWRAGHHAQGDAGGRRVQAPLV